MSIWHRCGCDLVGFVDSSGNILLGPGREPEEIKLQAAEKEYEGQGRSGCAVNRIRGLNLGETARDKDCSPGFTFKSYHLLVTP